MNLFLLIICIVGNQFKITGPRTEVEEAGARDPKLVVMEGGVVQFPGAHETNQGRVVKPKTGTSRPGGAYRGTTPPSKLRQSVLPEPGEGEGFGGGTSVQSSEGTQHSFSGKTQY